MLYHLISHTFAPKITFHEVSIILYALTWMNIHIHVTITIYCKLKIKLCTSISETNYYK